MYFVVWCTAGFSGKHYRISELQNVLCGLSGSSLNSSFVAGRRPYLTMRAVCPGNGPFGWHPGNTCMTHLSCFSYLVPRRTSPMTILNSNTSDGACTTATPSALSLHSLSWILLGSKQIFKENLPSFRSSPRVCNKFS